MDTPWGRAPRAAAARLGAPAAKFSLARKAPRVVRRAFCFARKTLGGPATQGLVSGGGVRRTGRMPTCGGLPVVPSARAQSVLPRLGGLLTPAGKFPTRFRVVTEIPPRRLGPGPAAGSAPRSATGGALVPRPPRWTERQPGSSASGTASGGRRHPAVHNLGARDGRRGWLLVGAGARPCIRACVPCARASEPCDQGSGLRAPASEPCAQAEKLRTPRAFALRSGL